MNIKHKMAMSPFDLRIAVLYALFGGLWILLSDRLLELLITDVAQLSAVQTYKGWIFVVLSAVYIYFLLRRELLQREAAQRKILQLQRLYATMSEVNQTIVHVKEPHELYQRICDVAAQFGGFAVACVFLLDEQTGELHPVAAHGENVHQWPFPVINLHDEQYSNTLAVASIRESRVVSSEDLQKQEYDKHTGRVLLDRHYHAAASIPFHAKGRVVGILMLVSNEIGLFRNQDEMQLLTELGIDISFALEVMEHEIGRKRAEEDLRALNEQLEQRVIARTSELQHANRAKDEFLANMSHELRTPLNTVLGLSETLLEQRRGPLNEKQVQSLELISSSGRHLLGLINDILEVSKIEAGKLELHIARVWVKEICESSLNFIRQLAAKKMISVHFHNEKSDLTMHADPRRLKQILINLLTNAVKFTPERGQITLDVRTNAEDDQVIFSVSDTGIGIAHDDLKKLFTPFTQLDSSLARQYAGSGLGLTLVQKLTDLHCGSVQVESVPESGSRFTVTLPARQNRYNPVPEDEFSAAADRKDHSTMPSPATPGTGAKILLAEDNETNREFLADYLVSCGYKVSTAQDGEQVLEKAVQTTPDIILMDIQMPKMDGLETMRHLRADARFSSTPIIALTALAMPGDKERSLAAGANEYLSKPVSLKILVQTIQKLVGSKA